QPREGGQPHEVAWEYHKIRRRQPLQFDARLGAAPEHGIQVRQMCSPARKAAGRIRVASDGLLQAAYCLQVAAIAAQGEHLSGVVELGFPLLRASPQPQRLSGELLSRVEPSIYARTHGPPEGDVGEVLG